MSQDRDIPKSDKSFEIKDIFLEVFFTYVEGNIDSPFSFSNLLNKRLTPHIPRPSLTITHVLSLLKFFSQLSFSVLRSDLCCTRLRG